MIRLAAFLLVLVLVPVLVQAYRFNTIGQGTATIADGSPPAGLAPPDLGDLLIEGLVAERVCVDANTDGTCEDFLYVAKPPLDTSLWPSVPLGANPTTTAIQSAIEARPTGCFVYEFTGTITVNNGNKLDPSGFECAVLRGATPGVKGEFAVQLGAFPAAGCTGSERAFVQACGGNAGSQPWLAGFDRGEQVLGVTDASLFSAYDANAPWGVGMFVRVSSDHEKTLCPQNVQREGGDGSNLRKGNDATHRVIAVNVPSNEITIWPGLYMDYDDDLPDCAGHDVRPVTMPLFAFENMRFSNVDGDDGCTFPLYPPKLDSAAGCTSGRVPYIYWLQGQGWATGSEFYNAATDFIKIRKSRDVWIEGNLFHNPPSVNPPSGAGAFTQIEFQSTYIGLGEAASGNAVVNNIAHTLEQFIQLREGAKGNVIADNYTYNTGRSDVFFHGLFAGQNLVQRNDFLHIVFDRQWGENGPDNTVYRNNTRGNANGDALGTYHDGPTQFELPPPLAPNVSAGAGERVNFIGNYSTRIQGYKLTPFTLMDDHNTPDGTALFNWGTVSATIGACSTCVLSENYRADAGSQPAALAAATVPASLFRIEGRDVSWMPWDCVEGVDVDPHSSIGAFSPSQGDLASKIRDTGGVCTLCDDVNGAGC